MDRNEVLKRLERLAKYEEAKTCGGLMSPETAAKASKYRDVFRAAAEIIRGSGWRPIAESPELVDLLVGGWVGDEWDTDLQWKHSAIGCGYTHYLPLPEPPAREVANDGE